jgi:hypothetical protein
MSRLQLLDIARENLQKHIEATEEGVGFVNFDIRANLGRLIIALEYSVDDVIELTEDEFINYVLNDWENWE